MSHSKVTKIEIDDENAVNLTVAVFGFEAGTLVEISGHATQANGAIATFYDVQRLQPAGPDGSSLMGVTAVPSTELDAEGMITVAGQARAVRLWGTVLDPAPPGERPPGIHALWNARP